MRRHAIAFGAVALLFFGTVQAQSGDVARGKEKSAVCTSCHGEAGNSASPSFPRLAGQYEEYLYRALLDYKLGTRKNPIMAAQVQNLSVPDMRDLAAYYAAQEGLYLKR